MNSFVFPAAIVIAVTCALIYWLGGYFMPVKSVATALIPLPPATAAKLIVSGTTTLPVSNIIVMHAPAPTGAPAAPCTGEIIGALCYPLCDPGYTADGETCNAGCGEGYTDVGAAGCVPDVYIRGDGIIPPVCPPATTSVYNVCYEDCDAGDTANGATCTRIDGTTYDRRYTRSTCDPASDKPYLDGGMCHEVIKTGFKCLGGICARVCPDGTSAKLNRPCPRASYVRRPLSVV